MGLKQQFKIRKYDWNVVVYYTVDEKQKTEIVTELKELQPDKETFEKFCKLWREYHGTEKGIGNDEI